MIQNFGNNMEEQMNRMEAENKKIQKMFNKDPEEIKYRQLHNLFFSH